MKVSDRVGFERVVHIQEVNRMLSPLVADIQRSHPAPHPENNNACIGLVFESRYVSESRYVIQTQTCILMQFTSLVCLSLLVLIDEVFEGMYRLLDSSFIRRVGT